MSKGIIVVDMPQNCGDCKYFGLKCKITDEKCNKYNQDGKPDWCPIKPIYGFDKKRKRIIAKLEKGMQYEMDESIKHRESENLFYYHWGMSKGYEHAIREIKGTVPDEQETL